MGLGIEGHEKGIFAFVYVVGEYRGSAIVVDKCTMFCLCSGASILPLEPLTDVKRFQRGGWRMRERMRAEQVAEGNTGMTVRVCYELHMKSIFGGGERARGGLRTR